MSVALTTSTSSLLQEEPGGASPNACVGLDINQAAVNCVLKQEPISVTLNGPAIFALSMTLALIIHFLEPRVAECLLVLLPILLLVHNDYHNYLGLGPGGTPATFPGYVRIAWFRLWALRDPFTAPDPDPDRLPKRGILRQDDDPHHWPLPYRPGPRPMVAGIAPQRQLDQHGTVPHYHALRRTLEGLAARNPARFGTARSCLEKHGLGLFARHPVNVTCNGEVCHVHDSDHSLHMNLHPEDIREVLAKGWGQRHPLAWKGSLVRMPVPEEFVMVYAPRDDHELSIVCRIIEAAIWYVISEKTEIRVERAT
ncbi:hypothetical protein CGRA01v4_05629 [Colletotrichum graminicola]|uniref:Luciferase domain-containing protein n=1 Tax=Colletotrichum graminicola (strain M1.001 / M2 / FGSC 10212) TaxID=645133 RepID=E3Q6N0_COLGM|nr:uncharacterized protein GLRG_01622 [Colletotrichum graminicola M1.001]EFQ26478.1 hypothetical protein GLRG_01622 [Colletotrichum graminicola M1.001]WDK14349.1 hypothetical protein CGRA01v4_05629 [Colletotrichum graminicola]